MTKRQIPSQRSTSSTAKQKRGFPLSRWVIAPGTAFRTFWLALKSFPRNAIIAGIGFGLFWLLIEAILPRPNLMVTSSQQTIFIIIGVVESIVAGFVAAWLVRMHKPLKQLGDKLVTAAYIILCLMVGSWRLHDILHARIDMSGAHMEHGTWQLIAVEGMFHFTSAVFGSLVLVVLSRLILEKIATSKKDTIATKTIVS